MFHSIVDLLWCQPNPKRLLLLHSHGLGVKKSVCYLCLADGLLDVTPIVCSLNHLVSLVALHAVVVAHCDDLDRVVNAPGLDDA